MTIVARRPDPPGTKSDRPTITLASPELNRDAVLGILVAANGDDRPTLERYQHDVIGVALTLTRGRRRRERRVLTQVPIDRYHRRREIAAVHYDAATRLKADFAQAGFTPRVTAAYADAIDRPTHPTGPEDHGSIDAKRRCRQALAAVGPVLSPILLDVVCLDRTAADWATARGREGKRAGTEGLAVLKLALDALAIHYGLIAPPRHALDRDHRAPLQPAAEISA